MAGLSPLASLAAPALYFLQCLLALLHPREQAGIERLPGGFAVPELLERLREPFLQLFLPPMQPVIFPLTFPEPAALRAMRRGVLAAASDGGPDQGEAVVAFSVPGLLPEEPALVDCRMARQAERQVAALCVRQEPAHGIGAPVGPIGGAAISPGDGICVLHELLPQDVELLRFTAGVMSDAEQVVLREVFFVVIVRPDAMLLDAFRAVVAGALRKEALLELFSERRAERRILRDGEGQDLPAAGELLTLPDFIAAPPQGLRQALDALGRAFHFVKNIVFHGASSFACST